MFLLQTLNFAFNLAYIASSRLSVFINFVYILSLVISYHERTCTLCKQHDLQDEYHVVLICEYFKNIREKYIKSYDYNRPSMIQFIDLMNTPNSKERFRMMLFLKITFKLHSEITLSTNVIAEKDQQFL